MTLPLPPSPVIVDDDESSNSDHNVAPDYLLNRSLKPLKHALDPVVCQKASRYAVRVYTEMSKRSQLLAHKDSSHRSIPELDRAEVLPYIGELLGKGGFNSVYELKVPSTSSPNKGNRSNDDDDDDDRAPLTLASLFPHKKGQLAIKFLSDDAMVAAEEFCNGAADLLMEAKYLTAISTHYPHPCLIQLHGVCRAGAQGFATTDRAGYFIIIDRLYDTLDQRIDVWIELLERKRQSVKRQRVLWLQRLMVAVEIASAIQHLHKLQVVFRDLKPDNVGLDYQGQVKLFDFGLAKELDPIQRNNDNLYAMSGGTGSRRFMAPEVALSEPYALSADIYSFGILLWEILALKKAFGNMSVEEHRECVIRKDERPPMDPSWTEEIQSLLKKCWRRSPYDRPEAKDVYKILRRECQAIYYDEFAPDHK